MTQTKRVFEDLLGATAPARRVDRGNTRDEIRVWFDDQPPRQAVIHRAAPAHRILSMATLRELVDGPG